MSLSLSSFFDCINLQGKGTLDGIGLELTEIGPILPMVDKLGGVEGYGKVVSFLAMALSCSSSLNCNFLSSFLLDLDGCGSVSTSFPLLNVIALADSKPPFGLTMVELGSFPYSLNYPMNSAICPICFFTNPISLA
ncbi:hypothetical protein ACFX13_041303 [Malus domestica]